MVLVVADDLIDSRDFLFNKTGFPQYSQVILGGQRLAQSMRSLVASCFNEYELIFNKEKLSSVEQVQRFINGAIESGELTQTPDQIVFLPARYIFQSNEELAVLLKKMEGLESAYVEVERKQGRERIDFYSLSMDQIIKNASDRTQNPDRLASHPMVINSDVKDLARSHDCLQVFSSRFDSRFFNSLAVEDISVIKKSKDREKLRLEFDMLANIPDGVKLYFPQVEKFTDTNDVAEYRVAKVPHLNVGQLYLNNFFNTPERAEKLIEALRGFVNRAQSVKSEESLDPIHCAQEDVLEKLEHRVSLIKELEFFPQVEMILNSHGYNGLGGFSDRLTGSLHSDLAKVQDVGFSHGDLCFSNILFNDVTGQVVLIDPRGVIKSRGGSYRSVYYDLAKFSHSLLGNYDLLVNGQFRIGFDIHSNFHVTYDFESHRNELLVDAFKNFLNESKFDLRLVRLIEASLFLSMIPFHKENPNRALAQLIRAVEIYKEIEGGV